MVDKSTFFMETTLRICSSLDIEKALWKCLLYLKDFMPVNQMGLHVYNYEVGYLDTYAIASFTEGKAISKRIHLPPHLIKKVENEWVNGVQYVERLIDNEMIKNVAEEFHFPDSSGIIMDLILEDKELGILSIINDTGKIFKPEHLSLVESINKPFAIALINTLRYKELKQIKDLLIDDNQYFQDELRSIAGKEVIGAEMGLEPTMRLVSQVAELDSPVLLLGETGTGKEVIANTIHKMSGRKNKPFIKINCGAIPESLIDSELFGHAKGSFTGAVSAKRGRFERAHQGTIFLDEIGELPLNAQVRLLRVLQEKEIEPVGGSHPVSVDIRVIAATHRDLEAMVEAGTFREDLYFRIKVFPITIPPLRERETDIPILVQHFIQKKSLEMKLPFYPTLSPNALNKILSHNWPGNVRELENAVERDLIICQGKQLTFSDINQKKTLTAHKHIKITVSDEDLLLDNAMTLHITKVLKLSNGKIEGQGGAAEILGINPNTLRNRMKKLGIPYGRTLKKRTEKL